MVSETIDMFYTELNICRNICNTSAARQPSLYYIKYDLKWYPYMASATQQSVTKTYDFILLRFPDMSFVTSRNMAVFLVSQVPLQRISGKYIKRVLKPVGTT